MKNILKNITALLIGYGLFVFLPFYVTGCKSLTPLKNAEAAYGSYVIAEAAAADLIQNKELPPQAALAIQKADAQAKPLGDALFKTILTCRSTAAQCNNLDSALTALNAAVAQLNATIPAGGPQ